MAEKLFQKPKVYDPTMAERVPQVNSKMQQMMDLGFDDIENTLGYQPEMEEKYGHIAEQLDAAQQKVKMLQEELDTAKSGAARTSQKLQSFQQVNRSQSALVRGELQKTRRKLAHMESIAKRLRDQAAWFQSKSPNLLLPGELQKMPTEEDSAEEHAELVQLHEKWEKDVAQLAADLAGKPFTGEDPRRMELEQLVKKQKKELDQLKGASQAGGSPSSGSGLEEGSLRKELEAAEEKAKEQSKKLKQLATAGPPMVLGSWVHGDDVMML
eukprot:symbB.v1.2.009696.t1/scaffold594.1/size183492/3